MKSSAGKELTARHQEQPTVRSFWHALSARDVSEDLLEWPPDLFGFTHSILGRTQAFRFVLSPPVGHAWPPHRITSFTDEVQEAGRQWSAWCEDGNSTTPDLLADAWSALSDVGDVPLPDVTEGHDWRICEALLILHTLADEACAGLGAPVGLTDGRGCLYRARGRELLARTGSLSRLPSHILRVLPKFRTPPSGTSLSSLSRYVSAHPPGVEVGWHKLPLRRVGTDPRSNHVNVLLLPWPLRVRESDFHPLEGSVERLANEPFGFFEFAPSERLDLKLLSRVLLTAREEVDSVDHVVLPEGAVGEDEIDDLEAILDAHGVVMLSTGVRQGSLRLGEHRGNWIHTGISPRLQKGSPLPDSVGERWYHIRQNKHHRWSLDQGQIDQYHLGGALHPHVRWWEAMDVPRRRLEFFEHGEEIALISSVCEDLAQIDEVADMIRAVGPTVVFALLLDGPQLTSRWAARYASVLADDPGSAVLTLTCYGMAQRSRPHGSAPSSVIALSKDPNRGIREIPLEAGAQGVLLTVCGARTTRHSCDGRWPVADSTEFFDVATYQVKVPPDSDPPEPSPPPLMPQTLTIEEISVLTCHAQAVAETLTYAPDRVEAVLVDAQSGSAWRAEWGIEEPSLRLDEAIAFIGQMVRTAARRGDVPTEGALLTAVREGRPTESTLEAVSRRVLRSAVEQRGMKSAFERSTRSG
jgi:hypothetical protein